MNYYYFDPFKRQYLFPEGFENYSLFNSFFQAYTSSGSILWFFWKNFKLIRNRCLAKYPEQTVPIDRIKKHVSRTSLLAFNKGTLGEEQKITVLGIDQETESEFFIKYAESELAKNNVINEGAILQQLTHLDFAPKLQLMINNGSYTLIQTNVLNGDRLVNQRVDDQVIEVLLQLSKQQVETNKRVATKLSVCFSHGDFCPWNMMLENGKLKLFDWEMAGYYPLGYDLFTYVFQTSFLLSPKKGIDAVYKLNEVLFKRYFKCFDINDFRSYFNDFASLKYKVESEKQNQKLIEFFRQLKLYAEKV